jgi:hypothetical protein
MAHPTATVATTYGHFDPGPEPDLEGSSQSIDIEMADDLESRVQEPGLSGMTDHDPDSNVEMTCNDDMATANAEVAAVYDPINNTTEDRMIIAIDFGTTFSSVAYTVVPRGVSPEDIDYRRVRCIDKYPGYEPPPGVRDFGQEVPTELWYDDGSVAERLRNLSYGTEDRRGIHDHSDPEESSSGDDDVPGQDDSRSGIDSGSEEPATAQRKSTRTTPAVQYWGYQVQQKLNTSNVPKDEARPLARFKLSLEHKGETDGIRAEISTIVQTLMRKRVLKNETEVYKHFLSHLLKHTKDQLMATNELKPHMYIQFVLCVPAKWPTRACRIMQTALEEAVIEAAISDSAEKSVQNMFMISEPEAAAECILAEARSELYVSTSWYTT